MKGERGSKVMSIHHDDEYNIWAIVLDHKLKMCFSNQTRLKN